MGGVVLGGDKVRHVILWKGCGLEGGCGLGWGLVLLNKHE